MARMVLRKLDYFFDLSVLCVIGGGGIVFHLMTVFVIKGCYGTPWGIAAFFLPGGAEAALSILQLMDGDYKYTVLLGIYVCVAACKVMLWCGKTMIKRRLTRSMDLVVGQ